LNQEGLKDVLIVDELENELKEENLEGASYRGVIHRDDFVQWFSLNASQVSFVFHLGARTDTAEFDEQIFNRLNLNFSKELFSICSSKGIPFVYASSAATYGDGKYGYDDEAPIDNYEPLNPYGWSKQHFDLWVKQQKTVPPFYAGLKFFNVYGPRENHKGRMASVVFHAYHQIKQHHAMKLFQSHHPDFKDGEQMRDFIHVYDVTSICLFLYHNFTRVESGIYNAGTGKARTFNDLVKAVFDALDTEASITYIPTPEDIRDKYQYFTEAKMSKLAEQGYNKSFASLEDGVAQYVAYLSRK
jgi:ADP-L-glycero-D-manno-heptose 6-epimerase